MNIILDFARCHWLCLALSFSTYWGLRAAFLFASDPVERLPAGHRETFFLRKKHPWIGIFFISSYHFIFNFIGALAGWIAFYILLARIQGAEISAHHFTPEEAVLFVIALLGLTGHLPQSTAGLMEAMTNLATKAAHKLEDAK